MKIKELHFDRFSSTPLECSAALVEYERGTGQFTIHCNHQMPGVAAIWMGPALRVPLDKLRFVTQDIGGGFGNKITTHTQLTACCLLARKLKRPIQWTEWRTDQHTANAHGNERWFHDIEVAVQNDGTMLGFKVKALDDCGAFPRYEPLGCIIWAQVTPGLYRWRNIRVDFTQVVTNKSPGGAEPRLLADAAALADRADLRHRRARARARSGRGAQEELREDRGDAVRDAERLRLRLGRLRALPRHRARADRLRRRARAGRRQSEREADRDRHRLDARLRARTTSASRRSSTPSSSSPGTTRWRRSSSTSSARSCSRSAPCRRARATRRSRAQVAADILGVSPDQIHVRPGHDSYWNSHAGLLRHVREPVRGHRARGGEGRGREALARDPPARRRRARRRRPGRHRPRGRLREDRRQPGGGAAVHGLRRDHQREQRGAPARAARHHAQLPPRLRAAVRDARLRDASSAT